MVFNLFCLFHFFRHYGLFCPWVFTPCSLIFFLTLCYKLFAFAPWSLLFTLCSLVFVPCSLILALCSLFFVPYSLLPTLFSKLPSPYSQLPISLSKLPTPLPHNLASTNARSIKDLVSKMIVPLSFNNLKSIALKSRCATARMTAS